VRRNESLLHRTCCPGEHPGEAIRVQGRRHEARSKPISVVFGKDMVGPLCHTKSRRQLPVAQRAAAYWKNLNIFKHYYMPLFLASLTMEMTSKLVG
jgi:hypothetical protein